MSGFNFDETKQSQLPFVEMLINMGYRYIPIADVMKERGDDLSKFILHDTAFKKLSEINSYEHNGQTYKYSDKDVAEAIDELENIPYEGLIDTSKKVFSMIMPTTGGKTIKVFHDGSFVSKSFRFIDFEHIENNDFSVTVEYEAIGKNNIRVDIVVFVNGIPFSLIENKKSSVEIDIALSQLNRNQSPTYCPRLFIYPQLLIGANKETLRYGTIGTPNEFYASWKERDLTEDEWKYREQFDNNLQQIVAGCIAKPIDPQVYNTLLNDLNGATYGHTQVQDRLPTAQDVSVYGLFRKDRLLDISKNFVLYDGGVKKVMRYQQYFAIKKMLKRISDIETFEYGEKRKGGILWHTQGSGKSLTMVMFVKALIEEPSIRNPRIIVVTDRKDLDRQIKGTFVNAGLKKDVIQATSGEHLLELIKQKDIRVITTLIHKFEAASKKGYFTDPDQNIFVLIDEAHRSQGGDANLEMNRIIPNACYIAFTGTPLLKHDQSMLKFGKFIDRYTIDDALEDEIILPLIYEGRYVDLQQDKAEIDRQTDRLTADLSVMDKGKLQYQVKQQAIQDNPQRINEIAYDIEKHYLDEFAGTGLKAQIVAPSKYSATIFQKYFRDSGKIKTALVISDENGIINDDDDHKKEVDEYLKDIKEKYQSLLSYEKDVIDSFKYNDDGVEILIVVDKLLTGFDAPRNTVLYLTKELKDHNLLQAIARVNRLYDNKSLPKTAGFIIDYSENAFNLKTAMELFGNYDPNDVTRTLIDIDEKITELKSARNQLQDLFGTLNQDDEAYLQFLGDETKRKSFYEQLNTFTKIFSECVVLQDFVHKFDDINSYRIDLKKFANLRQTASLRYADSLDLTKYKLALIKILDVNIKAEEAELLTTQVTITDKEAFERAVAELGSDKTRAEAILANIETTIEQNLEKDPEFYERFSMKISKLLEDMRAKKLADIDALKQARILKDQILNKHDDTLPNEIVSVQGADILYRNLQNNLHDLGANETQITEIVLDLMKIIEEMSIVDWHLNGEQIRVITNAIDDYLYDIVKTEKGISLSNEDRISLEKKTIELALNNHELI
jgi:type I restriction enzyme R subunit